MKYLLIVLEASAAEPKPNIDVLAADGRLGMLEGWKGMESLLPREAGDNPTFTCGVASLDKEHNASGFVTDKGELDGIAEAIGGTEIDGVKFEAKAAGEGIILGIRGGELSRSIVPNPCTPGMPLAQVCAATKPAKKTASVLNKLIYRIAKGFPGRALFVKEIGAIQELPENFELLKLGKDIDAALLGRIKGDKNLVAILIWNRGRYDSAPVLIHGGGILPNRAKKFSEAACSRGFRVRAQDLLTWVMRATGGVSAFK